MAKKKIPPTTLEEAEAKIKKAASEGKITYAGSNEIEDYEDIALEFLMTIFDVDYDECFISDESSLSDFAGCCVPDEYAAPLTMEAYQQLGRRLMVQKINETYGLDVDPHDCLIAVFERLRQLRIGRIQ